MKAIIKPMGDDILCHAENSSVEEYRIPRDDALKKLENWSSRYHGAMELEGNTEILQDEVDKRLLAIGREMFFWLDDGNGWASSWIKSSGPRSLTIQVENLDEPLDKALLDAPWELLHGKKGFLADDAIQLFQISRRIGRAQTPIPPKYSDLQMMFMAASPEGVGSLFYESEEAAILAAAPKLTLSLVVEESGTAKILGDRLNLEGPFEILHLSCHGCFDPVKRPVLLLEDTYGNPEFADAGKLVSVLGDSTKTSLVFLSACHTAESAEGQFSEPFVRELVRAGVANVLGWDGSVYDSNAAIFAEVFYQNLALYLTVPHAAALARHALRKLNINDPKAGRHWHLARLYMGPAGGESLAGKGLGKHPKPPGAGYREQFLDKDRGQVSVAKPEEFVGRRRQLQKALKLFKDDRNGSRAILLHGMGNIGKSSLAARIAGRMKDLKTVVIFDTYDALTIFDRLVEAVPPNLRKDIRDTWRDTIRQDSASLKDAMEHLLADLLSQHPVLLIIDDLERILEMPTPSAPFPSVKEAYVSTIRSVLQAFDSTPTSSKLLITSRYRFRAPDERGKNLADALECIHLVPMDSTEQRKQTLAKMRGERKTIEEVNKAVIGLAQKTAGGNPGLQDILVRPVIKGDVALAQKAILAIEAYMRTGTRPEDLTSFGNKKNADGPDLSDFFERMAFDVYKNALTPDQALMLQVLCFFASALSVPQPALLAAGKAAGVQEPEEALQRLLGLGLADDFGDMDGYRVACANPLARALVTPLSEEITKRIAEAVLPELDKIWRDRDGDIHHDYRAAELVRIALSASDPDALLLEQAGIAAVRYYYEGLHDARTAYDAILVPVFEKLETLGANPGFHLLRLGLDCAQRLGEKAFLNRCTEKMSASDLTDFEKASALLRTGRIKRQEGEVKEAEKAFNEAALLFSREKNAERDLAITRAEIADILYARGELDEALRIRMEEELPVFERLGDVRSKAATLGKIADILEARGELDEALRIRKEEELPVYERLGDVREKAITQGEIADILEARGDLDEALRIRKEEELPVFERLGDVREKAITQGKIADILYRRGELDEALRLLEKEVLIAFERMGDVREKAITQGKIADILEARGELDEVLCIHREERLPVFENLGDIDGIAHARYSIARILLQRGRDHETMKEIVENLQKAFAINLKLDRPDGISFVGIHLAQVLLMYGEKEEALKILDHVEKAAAKIKNTQILEMAKALREQMESE